MRGWIIPAFAALALAACQPMTGGDMPSPTPDRSVESLNATECAARGGRMVRQGRMQTELCQVTYSDAGRQCRDGDDCQGDCRAPDTAGAVPAGQSAAGRCTPVSGNFGCYTRIEEGRAEPTICVD